MTNIVDVSKNRIHTRDNTIYQWGKDDFVKIVKERKEIIKITDASDNNVYVAFNEIDSLIEALRRVFFDIKNNNYVIIPD